MGAVKTFVEDTGKSVGNLVGDTIHNIDHVLTDIDKNIIKPTLKIVDTTINNALKDPIGTIAKITTAVYAPYLLPFVNAADVLAHGGSMDDAFKAGALTYVGQEAFSNLELGSEVLADGSTQTITQSSLAGDLGNYVRESTAVLGSTAQDILSNAAIQGSLGAVRGGVMAAIQGKDIGEGIASGATSGAVSGGISAGFSDATKALGIDAPSKTTALAGKTIMALAEGKDPNALLANYLAYTINSAGADAIARTSKDAYDSFSAYSKEFNTKNSKYEEDLTTYQTDRQTYVNQNEALQKDIISKWNPIQSKLDGIQTEQATIKNEFEKQKAIYDNENKSVDERNAAAEKMTSLSTDYQKKDAEYTKLYTDNKSIYTDLESRQNAITNGVQKLDSTTGKSLQATRADLENGAAQLKTYRETANKASENYDNAIAEATTKNVLIDSVNSGVIKGETQEDGSIKLANGMVIKDGQFLQDGKNAFANADPIEQGQIRFTDQNGKQVWFDNNRVKQASVTDVQEKLFNQYGIKADPADVLDVVGQKFDAIDPNSLKTVAENKVNEQYNSLLGRDAKPEEIQAAFAPGQDALTNVAGKLADQILPTDQFFGSEDEKVAYAKQLAAVRADKGVGAEFTWKNPYTGETETHQAFTADDAQNTDIKGQVAVDQNAFTSQWQTVGDKRVFIHDDGSASVIDPVTGETSALDQTGVQQYIDQGLLNTASSGYPYGQTDLSPDQLAAQENKRPLGSASGIVSQLMRPDSSGGSGGRTNVVRGVLPGQPGSGQPGVQPGAAQKGVLPTGNPLEQDYLNIGLSKDKFVDPLSQLYQIQQAQQNGGEGNLAQIMFDQFNPTAPQATQPTQASGTGGSYYNYGQAEDPYTGAVDPFSPNPYSPSPYASGFEPQTMAAEGGAIMATPLMAHGGKTMPLSVNGVLPTVNQGRENFKDGKHVAGEGDGQSDDIPAWLADGEFVFPADVVSALGNGSTKAGTDKLYEMMHGIREHARSSGPKDLPPPSKKSPLDYLRA